MMTIPVINGGCFIVQPETVGTCNNELDDMAHNKLSMDRINQIFSNVDVAYRYLAKFEPQGHC